MNLKIFCALGWPFWILNLLIWFSICSFRFYISCCNCLLDMLRILLILWSFSFCLSSSDILPYLFIQYSLFLSFSSSDKSIYCSWLFFVPLLCFIYKKNWNQEKHHNIFKKLLKWIIWSRLKVIKCWQHVLYANVISFFLQEIVKKIEKPREIVNINGENLHIFWTTGEISMKFSWKVWLMIILNVTKNRAWISLSLSLSFCLSVSVFLSPFLYKIQFWESHHMGVNWRPSLLRVNNNQDVFRNFW